MAGKSRSSGPKRYAVVFFGQVQGNRQALEAATGNGKAKSSAGKRKLILSFATLKVEVHEPVRPIA